MEKFRETKITLSWNFEGLWQCELINGKISSLTMCEVGQNGCEGKCLSSVDIKFLENVHKALGELFKVIDEEHKNNGHSFSKETTEIN